MEQQLKNTLIAEIAAQSRVNLHLFAWLATIDPGRLPGVLMSMKQTAQQIEPQPLKGFGAKDIQDIADQTRERLNQTAERVMKEFGISE